MLFLRQLLPLSRTNIRHYVKKPLKMATEHHGGKQVHQEMLKHIHPFARINIHSDIYLKVRSSDVHEFPDGDALIAELHGGHAKNCTATMKVHVSKDEKQIDVELVRTAENSDFHCELAVPVRSSLFIETLDNVNVSNTYGEELNITAHKDIKTRDIRGDRVSLRSETGNIDCKGLLLAKNTCIEAQEKGNITLDKLQGDMMSCKTNDGNITINCCYVEQSKFETHNGCLQLKNVHKKSEVYVYKSGDIIMTGVHGNIYVRSNGGNINLQLSELTGENIIMADKLTQAIINITDKIEQNSYIEVTAATVTLDDTFQHLIKCISEDGKSFRMSEESKQDDKLMVYASEGAVQLGKLTWEQSMRESMGLTKDP